MKLANITLLFFSVVLAGIILVLAALAGQIDALAKYQAQLDELLPSAVSAEPYGGCDEAWQAPDSDGANWCRSHGFDVPSR